MSTTTAPNRAAPLGFFGALTILFIALKLTHVIDWSWLWVLAPMWIPFTAFALVFVVAFFFVILVRK